MMQRTQVERSVRLALAFIVLSPCATAQEPTAKAVHRAGQTFITWQEVAEAKEYRIYRAAEPIRDPAQAACVGSVDEDSTLNFRAAAGDFREEQQKKDAKRPPRPQGPAKRDLDVDDQLAAAREDPAYHFVIEPGSKPLGDDVGLFVSTAKKDETAHYAVVAGGKIVAVSGPVSEGVAMPEPVPQGDERGYVHWVDDVGTAHYPAFSGCSLNDDPGDGRPESGAPHGQINGYLLWDTSDIVDTPTRWEMTLKLTSSAPRDDCTVDVTPRRLQALKVANGEKVRWAAENGASGEAVADQWRLITIPCVRVTKSGTRLRIEK